jgi:hypothetical protein
VHANASCDGEPETGLAASCEKNIPFFQERSRFDRRSRLAAAKSMLQNLDLPVGRGPAKPFKFSGQPVVGRYIGEVAEWSKAPVC